MRRFIRILLTIIILVGLGIGGFTLVQSQQSGQAEPDASSLIEEEAIAQIGNLTVTIGATGTISPAQQVPLVFELSAPVAEVFVQEGDVVQAGDVLARLDVPDLEAAVTNAQIALAAQQASYDALIAPPRDVDIAAAEANLAAAQAQAASASLGPDASQVEIARLQTEIARNQLWQAQLQRDLSAAIAQEAVDQAAALGLPAPSVPNPADNVSPLIEQAENSVALADVTYQGSVDEPADVAALSSANAQIVSAQVQLDRLLNGPTELQLQVAQTNLQIAQLALEQAQTALNRAVLAAPFDGVIAQNALTVGELPPQGAAFQLINTSSFYVDVSVDETDIVKVEVGQPVDLVLDALPDARISGAVTRAAITPVQAGQLVTYIVRVTLSPSEEPIRAGMTATATIIVNELRDVLIVPNRFIRIDRTTQQAFVTIVNDVGELEDVPITLGVRSETESQIVSGLVAGQRVVLVSREAFNPLDG
ncbi:MAG: efflux RND transporter periplasmic adaptor subunit [Anaerolineae bacterium]|nr:efflux RND transporter periplasmic adaptor subunit [Anaerolineae bacterium]